METGTLAEPTFKTALQIQKVCDAILQSAKDGKWVETGVAAKRRGGAVVSMQNPRAPTA